MTKTNATLLLVDDDPSILLTVGDSLQYGGYTVIRAASGELALKQLALQRPDLIILDIGMPGLGGMGFLREISHSDGSMKYPVLVFTARATLNGFFSELDVAGFLPKTVNSETLLKEVDRIIRNPRTVTVEAKKGGPRKILLVEDDAELRDDLLRYFCRHDHDAWGVGNGFKIPEAVQAKQPDVIVIKYFLPHMNGPTVAQLLASDDSTRSIPVVLYDESGVHPHSSTFSHVAVFVPTAEGDVLLEAVADAIRSRSTTITEAARP
ncbi:MAG: response regulator [bacterium]